MTLRKISIRSDHGDEINIDSGGDHVAPYSYSLRCSCRALVTGRRTGGADSGRPRLQHRDHNACLRTGRSTVTGSGMNWQPGDHIQAEWGNDYSNLGSPVVVASDGTFKDSFAIPTNATQGSHQVLFWDQEGRFFEVANFDVTSGSPPSPTCPPKPTPSVSFSKPSGPIGTQFSAAGSGWYPNDTVAIHLPYGSKGLFGFTRITWPADSSGDWQVNITVEKPTPPGTYELIFSQSSCGGLKFTLNFTVTAPPPRRCQTSLPTGTSPRASLAWSIFRSILWARARPRAR